MAKTVAELKADKAALDAEMAAAEAAEAEANRPKTYEEQTLDERVDGLQAKVGDFTPEEVGKLREILSRFFPTAR